MKRRLFVALLLPFEFHSKLGNLQLEMQQKNANLKLRFTKFENLHITLAFLGYVKESSIYQLKEKLKNVCSQSSIITLIPQKIALAPSQDKGRMIWVYFGQSKRYEQLSRLIVTELKQFFTKNSQEKFVPHITLARNDSKISSYITNLIQPPINELLFKSISLLESHLSSSGPTYEVLKTFPLRKK